MNTQRMQSWRGELINSHERLKEVRALMRILCGMPLPENDDNILLRQHELRTIFRVCQHVYGTQGYGYAFVHILSLWMKWFLEDGELPDYVLRAHEMMLESGLQENLQRLYRTSVEVEFAGAVPDIDHDAYRERVGRLLASVAHPKTHLWAL